MPLYHWLLKLLPRDRRERYGTAMAAVFAEQLRAAQPQGLPRTALVWLRELIGLSRFAAREWRARMPRPSFPPRFPMHRHDVVLALRRIRREPWLAASVILTLALGAGITSAVFTVVNGVLLRPLPYAAPNRLVELWEDRNDGFISHSSISGLEATEWPRRVNALTGVVAYRFVALTLTGHGDALRLIGAETTASHFDVIGRGAMLGRTFAPEDNAPDSGAIVIVESLWRSRFGVDPNVVGQDIDVDGQRRHIIGVVPDSAAFPANAQVWIPHRAALTSLSPGQHFFSAFGRLADGKTIDDARRQLQTVAADLARELPDSNRNHLAGMGSLTDSLVATTRPALRLLLIVSVMVLLIVTANISGVLLARSLAGRTELAVRRALGASNADITAQLMTEAVTFAIPGAALAVLIAMWATRALIGPQAWLVPRASEVHVDASTMLFTLAVALAAAVGAQLLPLFRALRQRNMALSVRETTADRRSLFLRQLLVGAQIASAVALLITATLLTRSVIALVGVNAGFSPAGVASFNLQLSPSRYRNASAEIDFAQRSLAAVRSIPGVTSAGLVSDLPFSGSRTTSSFRAEGIAEAPGQILSADLRVSTPGYFQAMSIPMLKGRDFADGDDGRGEPVVIISRSLADRLWPGQDALGHRIRIGSKDEVEVFGSQVWRTVIGISGNVIHDDLRKQPGQELYVPFAQSPERRLMFAVRSTRPTADVIAESRARLAAVAPSDAIYGALSMDDRLARAVSTSRVLALVTALFAATAVLLAMFGLYAALTYAVTQRTVEFGIRLALGATSAQIASAIVRETAWVLLAGVGAGLALSVLMSRVVSGSLFGVRSGDVATITGSIVAVLLLGALAPVLPARRAIASDPGRLFRP